MGMDLRMLYNYFPHLAEFDKCWRWEFCNGLLELGSLLEWPCLILRRVRVTKKRNERWLQKFEALKN